MTNISVSVKNKKATPDGSVIVCGNSDYNLVFSFDAEWDAYGVKTARFVFRKDGKTQYIDKVFNGDTVAVPVLSGIHYVLVGVFAGELHTTTPARIPCALSVLCHAGEIAEEPPEDVYNQLMEEVGLATGRINALVRSQGTGASQTVALNPSTSATLEAQLISDGIHATIDFVSGELTVLPEDIANVFVVPMTYRPLRSGYIGTLQSLEFYLQYNEAEYFDLIVMNPTANSVTLMSGLGLSYALLNPYLPEVNDIRVGFDGTEYETAGDAVRAQMRKAMNNKGVYISLSGADLAADRTAEEIKIAYAAGNPLYLIVPCINQAPWIEDCEDSTRFILPFQSLKDGNTYTFGAAVNFVGGYDTDGGTITYKYEPSVPLYYTVSLRISGSLVEIVGYNCVPMDGGIVSDTRAEMPEPVELAESDAGWNVEDALGITAGYVYTVHWNGKEYTCEAYQVDNETIVLGNGAWFDKPGNHEPFDIYAFTDGTMLINALDGSTKPTFAIANGGLKKLDNKYLDLDWYAAPVEETVLQTVGMEFKTSDDEGYAYVQTTPEALGITEGMFTIGESYYVYIGDSKYKMLCTLPEDETEAAAGVYTLTEVLTGQPNASLWVSPSANIVTVSKQCATAGTYPVRICKEINGTIPKKYLPEDIGGGGSGSGGGTPNAVQYTPQTLTEEQQMQARANLGLYGTVSGVNEVILEDTTLTYMADGGIFAYMNPLPSPVIPGNTYLVNYDGTEYKCTPKSADDFEVGSVTFGNHSLMGTGEDTGEPFLAVYSQNNGMMVLPTSGGNDGDTITFGIVLDSYPNKIDPEYLPDNAINNVIVAKFADEEQTMCTLTAEEIAVYTRTTGTPVVFSDFWGGVIPLVFANYGDKAVFSSVYFSGSGELDTSRVLRFRRIVVDTDGTILANDVVDTPLHIVES